MKVPQKDDTDIIRDRSRKGLMSQKILPDKMSRLVKNAVSFRFRKTLKVRALQSF
jgi:hypothetical protein